MRNARRRAREIALQSLYAWQMGGVGLPEALEQARTLEGWERCDREFALTLIRSVMERAVELEALIAPCLESRAFRELSPVERAILYIGAFELCAQIATPFRVVLNEAIELGKSYGATDGYRFVNGVLEKIARKQRPQEFAAAPESA